ncbi:MAG: hypothetical protein QM784_22830 [Polyangiaceae bacterium]
MAAEEVFRVLEPDVTREDFHRAAQDMGFSLVNTWPSRNSSEAYEEVWSVPDRTQAIHYLEDPISGTNYLRIRGPNTEKLLFELRRVPYFYPEELLEEAAEADNHDDQVKAAFRLTVTFPQFEPNVYKLLEAYATQDADALLRQATLNAIAYRCWPQFSALFEDLSRNDPDERVRETAKRLLPYVNTQR